MSDQKFWNDYYSYWDNFVKEWFYKVKDLKIDGLLNLDPIEEYKCVKGLELKELPEPYIRKISKDGLNYKHNHIKAVVINLNPGASSPAECTKCIKGLNDQGALIERYANECKGNYSAWISTYGCLLNEYPQGMREMIPGVDWWQGSNGKGGRMRWMRSFYGNDVTPEDVFALELCPYHSKSWDLRNISDETRRYVWSRVIKPAVVAATEDDVSCITCIGQDIERILKETLKFERIASWENGKYIENECRKDIEWPTTGRTNNLVDMHYILYKSKCKCEDLPTRPRPFLCIWHKGGSNPPSKEFVENVETKIRERINNMNQEEMRRARDVMK